MTDDVVERCAEARFEMTSDVRWRDLAKHDQEAEMIAMKVGLRAFRPGDELPGGLVAVPKETTAKMRGAANLSVFYNEWNYQRLWSAMLAAAKEGKDEV